MTSTEDKKTVNELEAVVPVEEKTSPAEEYSRAMLRRRRISALSIAMLLIIELGIAGIFGYQVYKNNFHTRSLRELEIQTTGKINANTGVYSGETDFGYFFGDGIFDFNSGAVYDGKWSNNQLEGVGTLKVPSVGNYVGDFSDSKKNGSGVFTWEDGTVYSGEWKNDEMCGQGTYQTADGITYSGTFQENAFWNGTCSFSNSTGSYELSYKSGVVDRAVIVFSDGTTYEGEYTDDGIWGTGTMLFQNGDKYSGSFSDNQKSGSGVYTWSSGDSYDGTWDSDCMNGTGTYTYADGSYASGTFDVNSFSQGSYYIENSFGKYTFTISDGKATAVKMVLENGTTYNGGMTDGVLTGEAQIEYSNGDVYSGDVVNGRKSGQGTYTWISGASYDGDWAEDRMDGQGTYFYSSEENGYKLTGKFDSGKPDGECTYYVTSSEYYKTDWSNGGCVKVYE